jgi:hypothetical protein
MRMITQLIRGDGKFEVDDQLTNSEFRILLSLTCVALTAFGIIMHNGIL